MYSVMMVNSGLLFLSIRADVVVLMVEPIRLTIPEPALRCDVSSYDWVLKKMYKDEFMLDRLEIKLYEHTGRMDTNDYDEKRQIK